MPCEFIPSSLVTSIFITAKIRYRLYKFQVLAKNRSFLPDNTIIVRSRFLCRASSDFKLAKYRSTSFFRLGDRLLQFFFAMALFASASRNHGGIGCVGPFLYFSSNVISTLTRSPTLVLEALRITPCK